MKCKYCGAKIPAKEEFCLSCGKYAKSIHSGISETQNKIMYASYCFGVSILLLGVLYNNFIRLFTDALLFRGFDRAQRRNLAEVAVISAVTLIICFIIMFLKRLRFSLWKVIYGIISAAIIFIIEFLMISTSGQISSNDYIILRLQSIVCSLFLCGVLSGLIIKGLLMKTNHDINILFDEDYEIVSAVVISNIAVMIVTILSYMFLC